jgi:membrane protein
MAAAVAYRAMFALAPLFLLAVYVSGLVLGRTQAEDQILTRVEEFSGEAVKTALETFITNVQVTGDTAAVIGIALLFWTASSLFIELQTDLNDIFHVPQERIEGVMGFIRKRVLGFVGVLGIGIVLIALGLFNAAWRFLGDEILPPEAENLHLAIGLLAPLVSLILLPLFLGLFFQAMSAIKVRWRAVWWGSFFTSVAFLAAAYGAGTYFSWDQGTSAPQVAGSIFVILLLAFIFSTVFLFGAEVTKVIHDYLVMGDVKVPADRASAPAPEVVVSEPDRALPMAALFAFFGGLFVGWRRRR